MVHTIAKHACVTQPHRWCSDQPQMADSVNHVSFEQRLAREPALQGSLGRTRVVVEIVGSFVVSSFGAVFSRRSVHDALALSKCVCAVL